MSLTKTAVNKLLVAERKSMRQKQKQSAFMRKTLNIYNGMVKRAKDVGSAPEIDFGVQELRLFLTDVMGITCPYCAEQKLTVANITVDHDTPIARGGAFAMSNLRACCKSCNWQKGQLRHEEFRELRALLSMMNSTARTDVLRRLTIGGKWSFKS